MLRPEQRAAWIAQGGATHRIGQRGTASARARAGLRVAILAIIQQMQAKTQLEQEALAAKALEAKETALANAAIAKARGEAEAIRIKGEALRANPQVLQQLAIEKWNGELPKVTGGSTPFVKID